MDETTTIIVYFIIGIGCLGLVLWGTFKPISEDNKQKIAMAQKEHYDNTHTPTGEICCPRCHSSQITILARRWTPVFGFFTNKIDRVCLNCKHRF